MNNKQRKKARKKKLLKIYTKGAVSKSKFTNILTGFVKYRIAGNKEVGRKKWRMWARDKNTGKLLFEKVFYYPNYRTWRFTKGGLWKR